MKELCKPVDVTRYNDLPNCVYICADCGLLRVVEPEPDPVCLVKGGRKTDHGQTQDSCRTHPGPRGGDQS